MGTPAIRAVIKQSCINTSLFLCGLLGIVCLSLRPVFMKEQKKPPNPTKQYWIPPGWERSLLLPGILTDEIVLYIVNQPLAHTTVDVASSHHYCMFAVQEGEIEICKAVQAISCIFLHLRNQEKKSPASVCNTLIHIHCARGLIQGRASTCQITEIEKSSFFALFARFTFQKVCKNPIAVILSI